MSHEVLRVAKMSQDELEMFRDDHQQCLVVRDRSRKAPARLGGAGVREKKKVKP